MSIFTSHEKQNKITHDVVSVNRTVEERVTKSSQYFYRIMTAYLMVVMMADVKAVLLVVSMAVMKAAVERKQKEHQRYIEWYNDDNYNTVIEIYHYKLIDSRTRWKNRRRQKNKDDVGKEEIRTEKLVKNDTWFYII